MTLLLRELAPLDSTTWETLEAQAKETLQQNLTGRRLVDLRGPLGLAHHGEGLGRLKSIDNAGFDLQCGIRQIQPMIEVRKSFQLSLAELQNLHRGAQDIDLDPMIEAAREMAIFEDHAIFKGLKEASICGMNGSESKAISLSQEPQAFLSGLAEAIRMMRTRTLEGGLTENYHLVVCPETYQFLSSQYLGSHALLFETEKMLGGEVLAARALKSEMLLVAQREGAFELVVGQDFSLGYQYHDQQHVGLYFLESFTFLLHDEEAAVPMHWS